MNKLSSLGITITAPSSGFSEGQLKDDPGDGTGSGAIKGWCQEPIYAIYARIKKYLPGGVASDTPESETASDDMDSIEHMIGLKNTNVSEWANVTTYGQDAHVMYLGIQFVSMVAANTGNNPIDNPAKWLPCFNRDDAIVKWRNGEDIKGGFENVHNHRNAAYRIYFQWGKYNFGGDSGRNFQATGVHLDGTVVTGNPELIALFDIGGVNQYHLLDIIAPDVLSTRTLMNARGRAARVVDGTGGVTAVVGAVQNFQTQAHAHGQIGRSGAAGSEFGANYAFGSTRIGSTGEMEVSSGGSIVSGTETRMMNYTTGIPAVIVMTEI